MTQEEALKLLDEVQSELREQSPYFDDRLVQKQKELIKFIYEEER